MLYEASFMRRTINRFLSIIGVILLLLMVFIVLLRFYPYTYNFSSYPRITHTHSGVDGDPINVIFVGSVNQITQSFQKAGWLVPDPITAKSTAKIIADTLAHRSYPTAPVSNLYVFGRVQDLAFEKPTNEVQNRGHIRLWKTGDLINGQPVWIGQTSYDNGIELSATNHLPTHHIAPAVDLERNAVGSDLEKTGLVTEEQAAFTAPILYARNGGGDYYTSDGDVLVIIYATAPLPLQQSGPIYALKNGAFGLYANLLGIFGALLPLLVLIIIVIIAFVLVQLMSGRPGRRPARARYPGLVPRKVGIRRPKRLDHGAAIARLHGRERSPEWHRVEKEHLLREPACVACGYKGKGVQVHHIKPFHLHPQLELDPNNLITLCEVKGRDHHLLIGHLDNWESYNEHVRDDVKHFYRMTAAKIRADLKWLEKMKRRP